MPPINQPEQNEPQTPPPVKLKYNLKVMALRCGLWLAIFILSGWLLYRTFLQQWPSVLRVVYTPENIQTVVDQPLSSYSPTLVMSEPELPASFSATFINDLIQAILDASNSAEATAEVREMLAEEWEETG